MKTGPISFRPSQGLVRRLEDLRVRTGLPKSALVEQLVDEGERTRRYPGLGFRGPDTRRRAWVIGSPYDVWEVVQAWQDLSENDARAQDMLELSSHQLQLALAFYREFSPEIDQALALARRSLDELASAYPFMKVLRVP